MSNYSVETKLNELGLKLPEVPSPQGSYLPFVVSQGQVYLSGALPMTGGVLLNPGIVGAEVTQDEARDAAKVCVLNLLANLKVAIGDLDRVSQVVRLGGFVASAPNFTNQPEVINAASDLIVSIFGDRGKHSRFAVGVASLPRNSCVEIDAIVAITLT